MKVIQAFKRELNKENPQLNHHHAKALRTKLLMLAPTDLPWGLGVVLVDLVEHENSIEEDDYGLADLLEFLDGNFPASHLSGRSAAERILRAKRDDFSLLTTEQREAIFEWLQEAQKWPCFRLRQEQLRSAIEFWSNLVMRDRVG